MVSRHYRLFALLGLLVTLMVVGCGTFWSRPSVEPPPLEQPEQTGAARQPLTIPGPPLAIRDNEPLPQTTDQQPLVPPEIPMQTAQLLAPIVPPAPIAPPDQPAIKLTTAVSPAVPVSNGTAGVNPAPNGVAPLRALHRFCVEKNATLDNYTVLLRRREVVGGMKGVEEEILLKFRKQPWSVYFKWLGTAGKGREVVYVKDRFNNKIHIRPGPGDGFLAAGHRFAKDLNDPQVTSKSRHPITETGIGNMIDRFGSLLDADELADPQARMLKYLGPVQRQDYGNGTASLEAVSQFIPPGREPLLPRGGQRWWFFDTGLHLPVLIVTVDDRGQEVEYYAYEQLSLRLQGFSEEEFNPDILWRGK